MRIIMNCDLNECDVKLKNNFSKKLEKIILLLQIDWLMTSYHPVANITYSGHYHVYMKMRYTILHWLVRYLCVGSLEEWGMH